MQKKDRKKSSGDKGDKPFEACVEESCEDLLDEPLGGG